MRDDPIDRFVYYATERRQIQIKKERGDPWPQTTNPILQPWSFTNLDREHDRTTKWIAKHWRTPLASDPDLWFAMVIARFVNLPATLKDIGLPLPWDAQRFFEVMIARKLDGEPRYSNAYFIRADNQLVRETPTYQVGKIFDPLWQARAQVRPRTGDRLVDFYTRLSKFHAMRGFYGGQVIADTKQVEPLRSASDWFDWAVSGPGSRRGLNRILGRTKNARWKEADWLREIIQLRQLVEPKLLDAGIERLCLQNWQNMLCEFEKYERVRCGEGKPKQRYKPPPPKGFFDLTLA